MKAKIKTGYKKWETIDLISITPVNHPRFNRKGDLDFEIQNEILYHAIYRTDDTNQLKEEVLDFLFEIVIE